MASILWFLLFVVGFIVFTRGIESLNDNIDGSWPNDLKNIVRLYESTVHIAAILMLVMAVLSTGWIGEMIVRLSIDSENVEITRCQCCLRCVAKCIWCVGAMTHWAIIVMGFLMVIFSILMALFVAAFTVFVVILNGSCRAGDYAVKNVLCPGLTFSDKMKDVQDKLCYCSGTITGDKCVGGVWSATPKATKICGDHIRHNGMLDDATHSLIGVSLILLALIGLLGVSLRNRQRMSFLTEQIAAGVGKDTEATAAEEEESEAAEENALPQPTEPI